MRDKSLFALLLVLGLSVALIVLMPSEHVNGSPVKGKSNREKLVPVSIGGYDHNSGNTDAETVTGFSIDDKLGAAIGGNICCIDIPRKWQPGMKVTVRWGYNNGPAYKNPPPQTAVAEIPEYLPEDIGYLHAHFYPGHKVKVVVTRYDFGSPFYPLAKEDWGGYPVSQYIIDDYRNYPERFIKPPSLHGLKWARQWGLEVEVENKEK